MWYFLSGDIVISIKRVVVGYLEENCYIVTCNDKTIIIDPGADANKIISACENLNVVGILITHHHFDHIGALDEIEKHFNVKESMYINGFDFEIIKSPGHTFDSVSYYFKDDKVMFVGDFIFNDSIGRTDLPTGNLNDMLNSLKKISNYPDDIIVYPGHGLSTTLGKEKLNFKKYF